MAKTTKLILSTGNIVSDGPSIVRRSCSPRAKNNPELISSLRSSFHSAQQEYAASLLRDTPSATPNGSSSSLPAAITSSNRPPTSAWTSEQDNVLYIPRIDPPTGLSEPPQHYNLTAKIFFLPNTPVQSRMSYAREALSLVLQELFPAQSVDLLVVSFPGLSFTADCEWEADRLNALQGNDAEELATWPAVEELHRSGLARELGVAEFGSEKLARFLEKVTVRPKVNQVNLRNCCNVPPPLAKLAKEQGIELLVHGDATEVVTRETLEEVLGDAGVIGEKEEVWPLWVVKYTAVVRDRGVIENKGYFVGAELVRRE